MVDEKIWVNGEILSRSEFSFSPLDHGLTTGDGVFETLASYKGRIFELELHMQRLLNSARGLGIKIESQVEEIKEGLRRTVISNGHQDTERLKLRLTVTGGDANLGSDKGNNPQPFVFVASMPFALFEQETKIVSVPWPRNERGALCGFKTISYGENVRALAYAKERGGSEALFLNLKGNVCEGTGSNIFWVKEGALFTTPVNSGCLPGITRHVVLNLAAKNNIVVKEEDIAPQDLLRADEVFLTSSLREVQSVKFIDEQAVQCANGPVTKKLNKLFLEKAFS